MEDTAIFNSPLGPLRLTASAAGITGLSRAIDTSTHPNGPSSPLLEQAGRELAEYFAGQRRGFDLPLDPQGSPFQLRVWQALRDIPYGDTISYGRLAQTLGCHKAARAVGGAAHRNPLPILVPCHRLLGRGGRLTGFAWGLAAKEYLLRLEGAVFSDQE